MRGVIAGATDSRFVNRQDNWMTKRLLPNFALSIEARHSACIHLLMK